MTSTKSTSQPASPAFPDWFTLPPVLPGEDPAEHDRLYADVLKAASAVGPVDTRIKVWLNDFVYHHLQALRLRRHKQELTRLNMTAAMAEVVLPMSGDSDRATIFARKWRTGVPENIQQADQFLAETGASMATVEAAAFALALPSIAQLERMIAEHERCRDDAVLRIERYQALAAQRAALEFENKAHLPKNEDSDG